MYGRIVVAALVTIWFGSAQAQTVQHVAYPEISATWYGEPRWAWGQEWPASGLKGYSESFFESVGKGKNFFGSALDSLDYRQIEIRFSFESTSVAMTLDRNQGFAAKGLGVFPGSVWDVSNPSSPRRLNVCFSEDALFGPFNNIWDPTSTAFGDREIVFVMDDNYDTTGALYTGKKFVDNAAQLRVMYVWWPRLVFGYEVRDTVPAGLKIGPTPVTLLVENGSSSIRLSWKRYNPIEPIAWYRIYQGSPQANQLVDSVPVSVSEYEIGGLLIGEKRYFRLEAIDSSGNLVHATPQYAGALLYDVTLVGRWNERPTTNGSYGGVWGYADPVTGKEFALIPHRDLGLSIVDVSVDPPAEIKFLTNGATQEVRTWKQFVITNIDRLPTRLYDVTNIYSPRLKWEISNGAHTIHVYNDLLFLNGNGAGTLIYRLSETDPPVFLARIGSYYYHDIDVRNDTLVGAMIYGNGLEFVDITNPSAPFIIGQFNYAQSGAHNVEFTDDGQYLFVGDEIGSGNWTRVFDVTNLSTITLVSEMIIDSEAVVHNFYLEDTLLYVGHYSEGMRVWDVSDPISPREIAVYDTYAPRLYGYVGCWQAYPYLPSGKILAGDMQTGLYVLRLPDFSTDVDPPTEVLPERFHLEQNHPNPFNPNTTISYSLTDRANVQLTVLNLLGQSVRQLVSETQGAGNHVVAWDGRNESGRACASGVYFYRLQIDEESAQTRKMLLVK